MLQAVAGAKEGQQQQGAAPEGGRPGGSASGRGQRKRKAEGAPDGEEPDQAPGGAPVRVSGPQCLQRAALGRLKPKKAGGAAAAAASAAPDKAAGDGAAEPAEEAAAEEVFEYEFDDEDSGEEPARRRKKRRRRGGKVSDSLSSFSSARMGLAHVAHAGVRDAQSLPG